MRAVKRDSDTPRFVPDYIATSLKDVDFRLLKKQGIRYIAFDADSTLVPYRGVVLSNQTKKFLLDQKKTFNKWCIASNRPTNDLQDLASSIEAKVIRAGIFKRKPSRRYFKKVLNYLEAEPAAVAMIGDKLFADMFGAKRIGMTTVWVEHLGKDGPVDRLIHLRKLEKRLLRRYKINA